MSNVELSGNKKLVVLKLIEEGDKTIYDIREMKLLNRNTKKRLTTTGVNKLIKNLKKNKVIDSYETNEGEKLCIKEENVICKRSTEALKPDLTFMLISMLFYIIAYFILKLDLRLIIGAFTVFVVFSMYIILKVFTITEKKSIYIKQQENLGMNQGSDGPKL